MAFNKTKAIGEAQQLVAQGKLKDAIKAYLKIHKRDPKDQNVLNTLGDLYVRNKNLEEALTYYVKLADLYASEGFLVRAIAMYKKIYKLEPGNIHSLERLAELYTMQGMMNEARGQYMELAEAYSKAGDPAKAMEVIHKVLDLDPHNTKIQRRLAELYEQHGQAKEAADIYRRLAETLLNEGNAEGGQQWAQKAVALAPESADALLLQARLQQQTGKAAESLATLEKISNLEENPEALELLLGARLAQGEAQAAEELAEKLFAADNTKFAGFLQLAKHAAEQKDAQKAVGFLQRVVDPAQEQDPFQLVEVAREVAAALPDSTEAQELLARSARAAHLTPALVEALSRRAQAAEGAEDFARAKECYDELVSLEPQSQEFLDGLNRVREKLGEPAVAGPAPAEAAVVSEADLDEETKAFVDSSLTDIDLFSSYGMNDKGIELAEQLVARVPNHLAGNEKLLELYLGSNNDAGVVKIARHLEELYRKAENHQKAEEVASLAERYAGRAAEAAPAEAAEEAPAEAVEEAPAPAPAEAPAESAVHEVDLSAEWAMTTEEPAAPAFNAAEAGQELEFYLSQGLTDQAREIVERYEGQFPDDPGVAELRSRLESSFAPTEMETTAEAPAEAPAEAGGTFEVELGEEAAEPVLPEPPAAEEAEAAPAEAEAPAAEPAEVAPGEEEGEGYEVVLEEQPKEEAPASAPMSASEFMADLAGELDEIVAEAEPPPAKQAPAPPPPAPAAQPPAPAAAEGAGGMLAEVFEEFKSEMGEVEEIDDPESHYNLGIAYKEMGLLDEAISEFQKVSKSAELRQDHGQLFQTCTLLGLCFMDKGHPEIAVRWYDRALKTPGVDEEGALALRYDMGMAHEQAGNQKAALDCYMEVYGINVDYRDVGERIRELKGA